MKYHRVPHVLLLLGMLIIGAVSFNYLFYSLFHQNRNIGTIILSIIWLISYFLVILKMLLYKKGYSAERNTELLDTDTKVIAIVPSYNESSETLYETVYSILDQSYPVKKIYVVDDGSSDPIIPFKHEKVEWCYQTNQGKRYAQKKALSLIDANNVDYILTVDSDSAIEKDAVKKMIFRFQNDEELQAITGLVVTKNRKKNLLTRVTNLNIILSCIMSRPIRSVFGALETTSGALSMYKKDILFDNIDDYVSSGTYSDDRQLCYYSVLKGKAIGATDILVYSDMPSTFSGMLKQRVRWGKGSWKFFPKQMKNLSLLKKIFPIFSMIQVLDSLLIFFIFIMSVYSGRYSPFLFYIFLRYLVKLCQTCIYISDTEHMDFSEKVLTLIIVVPLELLFTILILPYAKYRALFLLESDNWSTRSRKEDGE